MEEKDKKVLLPLLVVFLLLSCLGMGYYCFTLEQKVNDCVVKFNDCTNDCTQFKNKELAGQEIEFDIDFEVIPNEMDG